jgi:chemotaxis protein MotB
MIGARRSRRGPIDIWPGYVDALSTLLLLFVFVLTVFMLAQTVLSDALTGRDQALAELEDRLVELSDLLAIERGGRREFELRLRESEARLSDLVDDRDSLRVQLSDALSDGERLRVELSAVGEALEVSRDDRDRLVLQVASLMQDVDALRALRERLEAEVAGLAEQLQGRDQALDETRVALGVARDRSLLLEAELADAGESTLLVQRELTERERELAVVREEVAEVRLRLAASDQSLREERAQRIGVSGQVERLNQELQVLREQLSRVETALRLREQEIGERDVEIRSLSERLNLALLAEVEDLSRYRSDFFGRLNALLGERDDIEVVGDRFRFQSELFFASGSAELGPEGREQLARVAQSLLAIADEIPPDLPWVLQVEGHTDRRPIRTPEFPSNWQLSTARAQAIVDFLIQTGVPPRRLSPAGYAEHHPVDDRDTPAALRTNRRIEIRLTAR